MKYYISLVVMVLLSGCTSTVTEPDDVPASALEGLYGRGMDCISIRTIRDYSPLDNSHLIIWSANRPYLVRLNSRTGGLKSSFQLSFSSRDDQLCPYGGDELVFDRDGWDRHRIASIKRITRDQAGQLKGQYGKDPKKQKAPEPKEIEGAEVEELG